MFSSGNFIRSMTVCFLVLAKSAQSEEKFHISNIINNISRHYDGDVFTVNDNLHCDSDTCFGLSSGTAKRIESGSSMQINQKYCSCKCKMPLNTFREDLRYCVDELKECKVLPFISRKDIEKIPFVFLPLYGQIVYPSKTISYTGLNRSVCSVSSSQFLTMNGWSKIKLSTNGDAPFRLYHENDKTFLQWLGSNELRSNLEGRLIVVNLECKTEDFLEALNPCISFRVFGSPIDSFSDVPEIQFASSETNEVKKLSGREYITITLCSLCLGILYVIVFLYVKKKKCKSDSVFEQKNDSVSNNDVIFGNAIPDMFNKRDGNDDNTDKSDISDLGNSQSELYRKEFEPIPTVSEMSGVKQNPLLTHSPNMYNSPQMHSNLGMEQDNPTQMYAAGPSTVNDAEKVMMIALQSLNEKNYNTENINIIDNYNQSISDQDEEVKAQVNGHLRKKLYFNPAYFEPELLMSPPPSAIEFLSKIREVIAVAKSKMQAKRYQPSLFAIPEEMSESDVPDYKSVSQTLSRKYTTAQNCDGCPGCNQNTYVTHTNEANCNCDNKQNSIERWLQNVPDKIIETSPNEIIIADEIADDNYNFAKSDIPDMIYEAMELEKNIAMFELNGVDTINRKYKDLTKKNIFVPFVPTPDYSTYNKRTLKMLKEHQPDSPIYCRKSPSYLIVDYETDSLEKINSLKSKKCSMFTESQSSPSLSTALPLEEEVEISNALYNQIEGIRKETKIMSRSSELRMVNETMMYSKIKYDTPMVGSMTIELENCSNEYEHTDSDQFEPDTLDRKKSGMDEFQRRQEDKFTELEKGRLLTLEMKHAKRQRKNGYASLDKKMIPPDVVTSNKCKFLDNLENNYGYQVTSTPMKKTIRGNHLNTRECLPPAEKKAIDSNNIYAEPFVAGKEANSTFVEDYTLDFDEYDDFNQKKSKDFKNALKKIVGMASKLNRKPTDDETNIIDNYTVLELSKTNSTKNNKTIDCDVEKGKVKNIVQQLNSVEICRAREHDSGYMSAESNDSRKINAAYMKKNFKTPKQLVPKSMKSENSSVDREETSVTIHNSNFLSENYNLCEKMDDAAKASALQSIQEFISCDDAMGNSSSESDFDSTDDICESGAESIETSSVLYKNTRK